MIHDQWLDRIRERIVAGFDPERIIVFGSYARGNVRTGSDIDLLVVLPHVNDKREVAIAIRRSIADVPIPKDIIVTTPEEIERRGDCVGTVLRPALREGQVMYERT